MPDFKEKIRDIIRGVVGPGVPENSIENAPLESYADEAHEEQIRDEIEEAFEIVFDEGNLEGFDELTLDGLVTRVTDLGGKLPE